MTPTLALALWGTCWVWAAAPSRTPVSVSGETGPVPVPVVGREISGGIGADGSVPSVESSLTELSGPNEAGEGAALEPDALAAVRREMTERTILPPSLVQQYMAQVYNRYPEHDTSSAYAHYIQPLRGARAKRMLHALLIYAGGHPEHMLSLPYEQARDHIVEAANRLSEQHDPEDSAGLSDAIGLYAAELDDLRSRLPPPAALEGTASPEEPLTPHRRTSAPSPSAGLDYFPGWPEITERYGDLLRGGRMRLVSEPERMDRVKDYLSKAPERPTAITGMDIWANHLDKDWTSRRPLLAAVESLSRTSPEGANVDVTVMAAEAQTFFDGASGSKPGLLAMVAQKIAGVVGVFRHSPPTPAVLEGRRDNGVEVFSFFAGKAAARVYVDPHTLALVRSAPKEASIKVFGSQALDMFSDDGFIARMGRLKPGSDIDLVVRTHRLKPDDNMSVRLDQRNGFYAPVLHAYPENEVDVEADHAAELNPYSFGALRLRFESLGQGKFLLQWDAGVREAERAYLDWKAKIVRYVHRKRMSIESAMQALVYIARYDATLEPATARQFQRAFQRARKDYFMRPSDILDWGSALATMEAIKKRFVKALRSAPRPGVLAQLLDEMGILDSPFYTDARGNPKPGPTARSLIAELGLPGAGNH